MNEYKNIFTKGSKMDTKEKLAFYLRYKTQLACAITFIVALIAGDQAKISETFNSLRYDDTEIKQQVDKVEERVETVEDKVKKIEKELPLSNQKEIEKKFPEVRRLDLSVLKGN